MPFTINSNDSVAVNIQFIGIKSGKYIDSLYINYSANCDYDTLILLNPTVTEEIYKINLSIPDYESQPYQDIDICINLDNPVPKFHADSLMIELRFDPWLLVPSEAFFVSGDFQIKIPSILQPGYVQVHLPEKFADTMFLTAGTKFSISAYTYPSSPNKTAISFSNVDIYSNKSIDLTKDDGSLEIIPVCQPTGRLHLILSDFISVTLKNNVISNETLSLDIQTSTSTNGTISVYSASGRLVYSGIQNFKTGKNQWDINLNNISNGSYYFVLYSASGRVFTHKFIVIN